MTNPHPWMADVYQAELRYYDKQQRIVTKYLTFDGWSIATEQNKHLIDNPGEFYIHIEAQLRAFPTQALRYSFIEVFHKGEFMQRQFVRFGQLTPFMSDIENRRECPYIRKQLISNKMSMSLMLYVWRNRLKPAAPFNLEKLERDIARLEAGC